MLVKCGKEILLLLRQGQTQELNWHQSAVDLSGQGQIGDMCKSPTLPGYHLSFNSSNNPQVCKIQHHQLKSDNVQTRPSEM